MGGMNIIKDVMLFVWDWQHITACIVGIWITSYYVLFMLEALRFYQGWKHLDSTTVGNINF